MFSIVVPTRNRPVQLGEALSSIAAQTFTDVEVICVDDGSPSQVAEMNRRTLESIFQNHKYIHLTSTPRGHGPAFSRNEGATAASNSYLCFLDDDDTWIDENYLSRASAHIAEHSPQLYLANQRISPATSRRRAPPIWIEDLPKVLDKADPRHLQDVHLVSTAELSRLNGFCHLNTLIVSRSLYDQVSGFDEGLRYEEDRDFYYRLLDDATTILYDRKVVSEHNAPDSHDEDSASASVNALEKYRNQLISCDKLLSSTSHRDLVHRIHKHRAYVLRHISVTCEQQLKLEPAAHFASQALVAHFSFKWLIQSLLLKIKALRAEVVDVGR